MKPKKRVWMPMPGNYASYSGRYSRLLRGGRVLLLVAEGINNHWVVEAIGHKGKPVRFTVNINNLVELPPSLF